MYNIKVINHKHLSLSVFKYYKSRNSISAVNIHNSCIIQLRKPASFRRNIASENPSNDCQLPEHLGNTNKNFYGIESDEGVIYPEKNITEEKIDFTLPNQSPKTEFRYVSFGAVRLDSENKPSYYARRNNSPLKTEKIQLKDKTVLNGERKYVGLESSQKACIEDEEKNSKFQSHDSKFNKESIDFKSTVTSGLEKEVNNKFLSDEPSENCIDDLFFSKFNESHKAVNTTDNSSNLSELFHIKNSQFSQINLNQHDFKTLSDNSKNSYISESTKHTSQNLQKVIHDPIQSILKTKEIAPSDIDKYYFEKQNTLKAEKLSSSYIDQNYFEEILEEQDMLKNESNLTNYIDQNYLEGVLEKQELGKKELIENPTNYIDQNYFEEVLEEKELIENPTTDSENVCTSFIEEQYFVNEKLKLRKQDLVSESDKINNKNILGQITENFNKKIEPKSINQNFNEKEIPEQSNFVVDVESVINKQVIMNENNFPIKEPSFIKENQKNFIKEQFIRTKEKINEHVEGSKTLKDSNLFKNNIAKVQSLNLSNSHQELAGKNLKKVINKSPENIGKQKCIPLISQKENIQSEDNSETAYEFVQKLNEKQRMFDSIKKGISAKKEKKVDSKGFRILKHQVPSLMYFTRDEILELLKDNVLYSDGDIVILNKPYNLVMHESSTTKDNACLSMYLNDLAKILDQTTNDPQLFIIHRLDKETTGCLILARNEVAAQNMKTLFSQRKIIKTYWIVTTNIPDPPEGIIDIPISEGKVENKARMVLHPDLPKDLPYVNHSKAGKRAVTAYSTIATSGNAALVEVKPETGLKHQIRVHFGFGLSCPILGDHKYSHLNKLAPQKLPSDLLQRLYVRQSKVRHIPLHIHAKHVLIPQYSEGRNLFVSAPLPRHMVENLRTLKFKKK